MKPIQLTLDPIQKRQDQVKQSKSALIAFVFALAETLGSFLVVTYLGEFWFDMWFYCQFVFLGFFPFRITIVSAMTAFLGVVIGILMASVVYVCQVG